MQRDTHIDIAKGIVIYTVVLGHLVTGIAKEGIFLFHMPFFFLVSGYFHKAYSDKLVFLKRKSISLLLPYATYLLIFKGPLLVNNLFEVAATPGKASLYAFLLNLAKMAYGGIFLMGNVGVFWFISCLFLTQQLFNLIALRKVSNKKILVLSLTLYAIAILAQYLPPLVYPWNLNVVLCSFLFYSLGAIWGGQILKNHSAWQVFLAAVITAVSVILLYYRYPIAFEMKWSYYGWPVFSPLAALALTKLVGFCAYLINRQKILSAIAAFAGTASITIMFTHLFFRDLFKSYGHHPWVLSFTISFIGCCLHYLFTKNNILKAFLLGDRKAFSYLGKKWSRSENSA